MSGKQIMKRNYIPFVAGMATVVLLLGLISASLAVNDEAGTGGAAPAQIGVGLFLRQQIAPGETLTTESGGKAPKVLSYPDTRGEIHYYIEAGAAAELFDVADGVLFNEEANQLEFCAVRRSDGTLHTTGPVDDFPATLLTESGLVGPGVAMDNGGFTIEIGSVSPDAGTPEWVEAHKTVWEREIARLPVIPEYGETLGMYTEVDPAEINLGSFSGRALDGVELEDPDCVETALAFTPKLGKYAAITVQNTGASDVELIIRRPHAVGRGTNSPMFTIVRLPAGEKLVRAFRVDETKELENQLNFMAAALGADGVHIRLTTEQYRSGK